MGQAEEHLPPDLKRRATGVGGGARENRDAAAAHAAAMSATSKPVEPNEPKSEAQPEEKKTLTRCPTCDRELDDEWNFCAKCGANLVTDPKKLLHIEFEGDDLDQYLFQGYLTKTVLVAGREMVIRSSMAGDHEKISTYLMTAWNGKEVTQDFWENLRNMAAVSLAIVTFDGKPIGDGIPERVEWVMGRGSALVDMMLGKVVLFNRAVTAWLEDKNTFLAS